MPFSFTYLTTLILSFSLLISFHKGHQTRADDAFICCAAGWKSIRGVTLCPKPCCPGYSVKTSNLPSLGQVSYCTVGSPPAQSIKPEISSNPSGIVNIAEETINRDGNAQKTPSIFLPPLLQSRNTKPRRIRIRSRSRQRYNF